MSRGWALVSVFALFLAGISIGALAMHLYLDANKHLPLPASLGKDERR